jgi:hypothetical protein
MTRKNDSMSQKNEAFDIDAFVKSIDERISEKIKTLEQKVNEKIDNKQDFAPYINFTVREIFAAQRKKSLVEKLQTFQESDAGKMTVKELLTSTSNIALPTMVQAAALLALNNWADLREIANIVNVPKGAGKTIDVQMLTQPAFESWTEGSALSAADPTVAKGSITLAPFGKVTQISDLLANTSAFDFVDSMGTIHGGCVRQGIFQKITVALSAAAGNTISAGSGSTLQFADVTNAIKEDATDAFQPDFIVTSPSNMWTAFTTSHAVTQFYGSLNNLFAPGVGQRPKALGLDWYPDPYWDTVFPAALKRLAYVGSKKLSVNWGQLQPDPIVELYRVPTELSSYVVTHLDGGAIGGFANSICKITHAS